LTFSCGKKTTKSAGDGLGVSLIELRYTTIATNCVDTANESSSDRYLETCLTSVLVEADATACSAASINAFTIDAIRPADILQPLIATITDTTFTSQLMDTSVSASK
jgi:hypothetical protein